MSKELKIGDQVQINKVDPITAKFFPKVVGSHVTVIGFDDLGQGAFFNDDVAEEGYPYQRLDAEHFFLDESSWEYEIL